MYDVRECAYIWVCGGSLVSSVWCVYEIWDMDGVCGGTWVYGMYSSVCGDMGNVWGCRGYMYGFVYVMCSECGGYVCACMCVVCGVYGGLLSSTRQLSWHLCPSHHSVFSSRPPLPEYKPILLLTMVEIGKLFLKRT